MRSTAVALMILVGAVNCPGQIPQQPTQSCAEDDPCWNCDVDGNKECGPGTRGAA